ncbi:F-box/LRR-repeat protein At3g58900-like [Papaver somniferum]|uniref:F-box/LRR-repeat protein At3g58900-like n=1 Tax=Papaver somniferum TaxID=3469 RepID=UPI000E70347E|nr:F-box/LRR-repeat protein At3g58900-like [Papaver somniferum]
MDLADSRIDYLQLKSYWWDKKNNMSELEDRISNLPASILHHILSFVHTRVAARTSVLSKRWKYIWRSIPSLQFRCHKSSRVQKFMRFVDTTLELHDSSNIQSLKTMTMQVIMGVKTTTTMTLLRMKITMTMKTMVGHLI